MWLASLLRRLSIIGLLISTNVGLNAAIPESKTESYHLRQRQASDIAPDHKPHLWFTAVGSGAEQDYLLMLQASIESGLQCCGEDLFPVVVIGGCPSLVPQWLVALQQTQQILVVNHNLTFSSRIVSHGRDKSISNHGAFQRLDIPLLVDDVVSQLNQKNIPVHGDYVMYTDADVLLHNINSSNFATPDLIAYGAEDQKNTAANSGVLFMNVATMKKEILHLFDFADNALWEFPAIEQGLILQYFKGKHTLLSDGFNWKPYWGINHDAYIVHFHGAKIDRCVECFIQTMYTEDAREVGKCVCADPHILCGQYALWVDVAKRRYKLNHRTQTQAYVFYMQQFYKFVYDMSVRVEWAEKGQIVPLPLSASANVRSPYQAKTSASASTTTAAADTSLQSRLFNFEKYFTHTVQG